MSVLKHQMTLIFTNRVFRVSERSIYHNFSH
ncbi:unnamed protein product [Acanthoscelides obtectus]|uniref:Uncharacterized protein n=1 Tax=Acanthoscelides obtectus TaxID=200917 RepID=A0A9P0LEK2_ACAOB|nr:unnamed protein product [Acanthoscelides obtectus]CAK1658427.1 hypothetical protein AOBTE_LOCUS20879 [Acanthoscelides obtectus]